MTHPLWNAESDTRPWAQTQELQLAEFGRLLDRLAAHDAWAVRLPRGRTFAHLDDLLDVPFTLKEDLRAARRTSPPTGRSARSRTCPRASSCR